ncbi:hypothetical protein OAJ27_01410 [bacterium]|nr:hypothetical protein [bacterium]
MILAYEATVIHTLCFSALMFLIGSCVMPLNKRLITLDFRLYVGLFAALFFLLASSVFWVIHADPTLYWVFFTGVLCVVPVVAYLVALLVYLSMAKVDHTYFFALWYCGTLSVALAFQAYAVVGGVLLFGGLLWAGIRFLRHFHLISSVRTLTVSAESYDVLMDVQKLLDTFQAHVVSLDISKQEDYVLTCQYRLAALGHHIFSRYMFKSSRFSSITIHDG